MKRIKFTAFIAIVLVFILITSLTNIALMKEPVSRLINKETSFSQFIDEVKTSYTSDFKQKNTYVNINGLFSKLTGRSVLNKVARAKNGMLINQSVNSTDFAYAAQRLAEFSDYMESKGKKYLYVQAPYKMDLENKLLPDGVENYANEYADTILAELQKRSVDTFDLRTFITATPEMVEKNYFVTDHHWNVNGSFIGYTEIVNKLCEIFPDINVPSSYTDRENWESTYYEKYFLGSHGKRVGKYFAGVDDIEYLTPKFETKISTYVPNHLSFKKGDFVEANMALHYFEEKPKYFEDNVYCMYLGGDYPIVHHRNAKAPADLKILILKDSYCSPVQSFLSTVFTEVEVLDPRYYKGGSVAQYVEASNPDIVISLMNPSVYNEQRYYNLGHNNIASISGKTTAQTVKKLENLKVSASDNQYNNYVFPAKLSGNTKYTFSFDDVICDDDLNAFTVAVYNPATKTIMSTFAFDIEYCRENGFEYSFITPNNNNIQLLVYSGLHGDAQNKEITIKNATVTKFK